MSRDRPPVLLVNCVCTFSIDGLPIDLNELVIKIPFCEFNKRKFAAASLRLKTPRSTCLIFSSGNLVVTGSRSEAEALLASRRYCHILAKFLDRTVRMRRFQIQNIVASVELPWAMDLVAIANVYQTYCSYEPEVFPGLIFRLQDVVVLLIFRSGRIVITGAKCRKTAADVFDSVYEDLLCKYKDTQGITRNSADYRVEQLQELALKRQRVDGDYAGVGVGAGAVHFSSTSAMSVALNSGTGVGDGPGEGAGSSS